MNKPKYKKDDLVGKEIAMESTATKSIVKCFKIDHLSNSDKNVIVQSDRLDFVILSREEFHQLLKCGSCENTFDKFYIL